MTAPLTVDELRAIEERADAATEGPWAWMPTAQKSNEWAIGKIYDKENRPLLGRVEEPPEDPDDIYVDDTICTNESGHAPMADANFISHAREDVPRLIATVKALRMLLHGVAWNDAGIDMALRQGWKLE